MIGFPIKLTLKDSMIITINHSAAHCIKSIKDVMEFEPSNIEALMTDAGTAAKEPNDSYN